MRVSTFILMALFVLSISAQGNPLPDEEAPPASVRGCMGRLLKSAVKGIRARWASRTPLATDTPPPEFGWAEHPEVLLKAYSLVLAGGAELLDASVRRRLLQESGLWPEADLNDPEVQQFVGLAIRGHQTADQMEVVLGKMLSPMLALGSIITHKRTAEAIADSDHSLSEGILSVEDTWDLGRDWGFRLLPDEDPAFDDPVFLARMLQARGQSALLADRFPPLFRAIYEDFEEEFSTYLDKYRLQLESFHLTGSDANEQAAILYGPFAVMSPCWGASRGAVFAASRNNFSIDAPVSTKWGDGPGPFELTQAESAALHRLQTLATEKKIRGVFLEPIIGAGGVRFYRPGFLKVLAERSRKMGLTIIVDEVLTGGGRTGEFFGFEHYEDFTPDVVTFGKGLQIAGIAVTDSLRRTPTISTTIRTYLEPMMKATQILKAIRERHLIGNAAGVGDYFVQKLREKLHHATEATEFVRGRGLLIFVHDWLSSAYRHDNRVMPPLTITREEVDQIISTTRTRRQSSVYRGARRGTTSSSED